MKEVAHHPKRRSRKLYFLIVLLLAGCSETAPSVFEPAGPAAASIAWLGWIFIILGTLIFLGTMGYLLYALLRRRTSEERREGGTKVVIAAGLAMPAVVLLVLFVLNTNVLGQVSAPGEGQAKLTIDVTGHQWWWEVSYPAQQFSTANEIHIPVGQPVLLKLTSADVIHSFWVPELHGKMDLIPGRVNNFWIQADKEGDYVGECAEYCGTQHAKMLFRVIAQPQKEFDAWLAQMQQPAVMPKRDPTQRGQAVFLAANCIQCHTIKGTNATGALGPNLTHLASRETLGAGILPLTRANLGGWVSNPQGVKPGVKMPPSDLSPQDFNALLDFLMSLE